VVGCTYASWKLRRLKEQAPVALFDGEGFRKVAWFQRGQVGMDELPGRVGREMSTPNAVGPLLQFLTQVRGCKWW